MFILGIFRNKREDRRRKEISDIQGMSDMMNSLQGFTNSIYNIVERSGWDVYQWNMKDLVEFMNAANKMGEDC